MAYDVWFGGVALSSITPRIRDVRVLTLNPGELPNVVSKVDPPLRHGSIFTRSKLDVRPIKLSIILGGFSYQERFDDFMALCAWAYSGGPKQFTATHMRRFYFDAICTSLPEFVGNDAGATYDFVFTALQPEYISADLKTAAYNQNVVIGGALPTWVDLSAPVAASPSNPGTPNYVWTLGDKSIKVMGAIPEGTINIYSEFERIEHVDGSGNVTSMAVMLTYDSAFWRLAPGTYTPTAPSGTFSWRERHP